MTATFSPDSENLIGVLRDLLYRLVYQLRHHHSQVLVAIPRGAGQERAAGRRENAGNSRGGGGRGSQAWQHESSAVRPGRGHEESVLDSVIGGVVSVEAMNAIDTERIVARVLSGDLDAYGEIVQAYQQEVWQVVSSMLFDNKKTEDLVQQAFINAYRHLDRFEPGRDFGRWLKEIARNLVRDELRARCREDHRLELYRRHLLSACSDPAGAEAEHRLAGVLAGCEQKLPSAAAQLVNLRYRQALNFAQIASRVGRTVEATRQQLARIRLTLRDCILKQLAGL